MRNKLSVLALSLVLGAGMAFAAPPMPDTQTVNGIQSRLDRAHVNLHGYVQVSVENGVATLTGYVDNLGSKLDAEKAARKTSGVTQVVDNIQVRASGVNDQQILEQARHDVRMYYAFGVFDYATFKVDNGVLSIDGAVTQPFKKIDIGRMLERVKGVSALHNNLEVLPNSSFDDRLRLQIARRIYGDPLFLQYGNQAQPPIHIIVDNGHVTLEGVVLTELDKTQAGMQANLAGLAFSVQNNLRVVKG